MTDGVSTSVSAVPTPQVRACDIATVVPSGEDIRLVFGARQSVRDGLRAVLVQDLVLAPRVAQSLRDKLRALLAELDAALRPGR